MASFLLQVIFTTLVTVLFVQRILNWWIYIPGSQETSLLLLKASPWEMAVSQVDELKKEEAVLLSLYVLSKGLFSLLFIDSQNQGFPWLANDH